MGASTTADRSMIDQRSNAYFYEKMYVVYEDNRGKLRFLIKVKMNLRGMAVYEFTKIINSHLRFTNSR